MDTNEREKLITDAVAEFEAGLRSKAGHFITPRFTQIFLQFHSPTRRYNSLRGKELANFPA
jgi:hypothetical protein